MLFGAFSTLENAERYLIYRAETSTMKYGTREIEVFEVDDSDLHIPVNVYSYNRCGMRQEEWSRRGLTTDPPTVPLSR